MTTLDELLKREPARDRYGRYLVRLPGDKKARGRTRVTTFIKALDQGDGLIAWKATACMIGALRNPGLHSKWAAIFAESTDPWYASDDLKTKCKKLVDECADHGGAQSRASLGTALHTMVELVARGESPELVEPYASDVAAWSATLAAAKLVPLPKWTEVCVYIERYDLVGTFDGLLASYGLAGHILSDLKTETSTDYKALNHAAQLAAYSLATHRIIFPDNPDDECTLEPLPDFDRDTGLIIHLPAGEARCSLHAVDLAQGRDALEVASTMRRLDAQRKRKDTGGLMRPWTNNRADVTPPGSAGDVGGDGVGLAGLPPGEVDTCVGTTVDVNAALSIACEGSGPTPITQPDLIARLRAIGTDQPDLFAIVKREWPIGKTVNATWTDEETATIAQFLDGLDVEGPTLPADVLDYLGDCYSDLTDDQRARVKQWVIEADSDPRRYRSIGLGGGNHTTRRVAIAEACMLVAGRGVGDAAFDLLLMETSGRVHPGPTHSGHSLGAMNWREAQQLLAIIQLHLNLDATITTDDTKET